MSQENVVRRNPKGNRRKNTDGYRTDSGCFEDVDLRHSPPSDTSELVVSANQVSMTSGHTLAESASSTDDLDVSTKSPSLADDCADDKDIHGILKRLADLTSDPKDLYRLCYNSRLSFCGQSEEEGCFSREGLFPCERPSIRVEEICEHNNVEKLRCDGEIPSESGLDYAGVQESSSSGGHQSLELLSLLSSFAAKAKENPNAFYNSSLGNSLVVHLSSLLSTLEEAKKNTKHSSETSSNVATQALPNNLHSCPPSDKPPVSSTVDTKAVKPEVNLIDLYDEEQEKLLLPEGTKPLETKPLPSTNIKTSFAVATANAKVTEPNVDLIDLYDEEQEKLYPSGETQHRDVLQPIQSTCSKPSESEASLNENPLLSGETEKLCQEKQPKESDNPRADVNIASPTSSVSDDDDVVTSGRRAVKPYSWDYGDIWETELGRTDSLQDGGQGVDSRKELGNSMPSFEEIRDELFHKAGFISDSVATDRQRRSRSADARSSLQGDRAWSDGDYTQHGPQSPFVRTIYQHERPPFGLRRSWSCNHIGNDSVMVNVNWNHGRQMRVVTGPADQGFDVLQAQIIKEAVVKTSTFRGPKPWSVLKRKPSGLRRRFPGRRTRHESFRSSTSEESPESGRLDHESESSDSPNVSATSSDYLDDSSSITSSAYYGRSSLPSSLSSSPSVSNRNSACFSDTSDGSDTRRVVFQTSESTSRDAFFRGYGMLDARGISLDQRFGCLHKHDINKSVERDSVRSSFGSTNKGDPEIWESNPSPFHCDYYNRDSTMLKGYPSTLPCDLHAKDSYAHPCALPWKWQGDRFMSSVFVRSDTDLNRLTKVQFVGDSYSRSRISKNLRHTRHSSSPVGPRSVDTRVVSCEIKSSNNAKHNICTKVSMAGSLGDDLVKLPDGRSTKFGHPSTRRSWHGQSRHSKVISGSDHQRPVAQRPSSSQGRIRAYSSALSLQQSSERSRIMSDSVAMNRARDSRHCKVQSNFEKNFNNASSYREPRAAFGPPSDVGMRSGPRRWPSNYLTAIERTQGSQKQGGLYSRSERHLSHSEKAGRHSTIEKTRLQNKSKEPAIHIVKETSFVGPSTFTKYQSSSNAPFSRTRRSRSLNEKDTMSRRRLNDSDIYRSRAMKITQSKKNHEVGMDSFARSDSDIGRLSERRRRYSEGASRHPSKHIGAMSEGIVDASYCDPRRISIREGTYSIVSAESARNAAKSDDGGETLIAKHIPEDTKHVATDAIVSIEALPLSKVDDTAQAVSTVEERKDFTSCQNDTPQRNYFDSDIIGTQTLPTVNNIDEVADSMLTHAIKDHELVVHRPLANTIEVKHEMSSDKMKDKLIGAVGISSAANEQLENPGASSVPDGKTDKNNIDFFSELHEAQPSVIPYQQSGKDVVSSGIAPEQETTVFTSGKQPDNNTVSPVSELQKDKNDTADLLDLPEENMKPNEVKIVIDYRNKRPISVEYSEEDVSVVKMWGRSARTSRKNRRNSGHRGNKVEAGGNNATSEALNDNALNVQNEELTQSKCEDVHEEELLPKTLKLLDKRQDNQEPDEQPSPEPYRRDSTIIYTDARTSFSSDTDSISHGSTISSSGSDMTVILHDDFDISTEDLRQLTADSSIDIDAFDLEPENDHLEGAEKMPPPMEISKTFVNYPAWKSKKDNEDSGLVSPKETPTFEENAGSFENVDKNPPTRSPNAYPILSHDFLMPASHNMRSSSSSIASSRASSKSTGTDKGKDSESGGKGFFSRLKSFRNSFRTKNTNSLQKNGKKLKNSERNVKECGASNDDVSRHTTDRNANLVAKPRSRTKSDSRLNTNARRSYDVSRHASNSLRDTVGVKSISSDHLNAYRIYNNPPMPEITAKSLEILVETCI